MDNKSKWDMIIDWIVKIAAVLVIPLVIWGIRVENHRAVQEERYKAMQVKLAELKVRIDGLQRQIVTLRQTTNDRDREKTRQITRLEAQLAALLAQLTRRSP